MDRSERELLGAQLGVTSAGETSRLLFDVAGAQARSGVLSLGKDSYYGFQLVADEILEATRGSFEAGFRIALAVARAAYARCDRRTGYERVLQEAEGFLAGARVDWEVVRSELAELENLASDSPLWSLRGGADLLLAAQAAEDPSGVAREFLEGSLLASFAAFAIEDLPALREAVATELLPWLFPSREE